GSVFSMKGWGLREWFVLTYIMGAIFIAGQAVEYTELINEGVTIQDSAYGTMFYLTTGFHGIHVVGGPMAFLFVLGRPLIARRFTPEQAVSAIVVSYYWHFVDVVWIGLFATIYLIQEHFPIRLHLDQGLNVRLLNRSLNGWAGRVSRHRRGPLA